MLHEWAAHQQQHWPLGMTTLSTHDTKRSEDVRARLIALAADAESWAACSEVFAEAAPRFEVDRPTAHLVWQTLAGVGPASEERLEGYFTKALREAKQHTSWVDGDPDYEQRVLDLVAAATRPGPLRAVVATALEHNREAVRAVVLGQKLLQLTVPGAPDTYQGCEVVNLSLVDPDNRRPVDYEENRRRLEELAGRGPADLDDEKLLVTTRALALRKELRHCFGDGGSYRPVEAGHPARGRLHPRPGGGRAGHPGGPAPPRGRRLEGPSRGAARRAVAGRADRSAARGRTAPVRRGLRPDAGGAAAAGAHLMRTLTLWAPAAGQVELVLGDPAERLPMTREGEVWSVPVDAPDGTLYAFSLDGGDPRPDPRGLRLPDGPHGWSALYDPTGFAWTDQGWAGAPLEGAVLYELHVGTFTPEGTLDAAAARLNHLVSLGVSVVELLPLSPFPGAHGWGYDGVAPWAVHEAYGGPEALQRFVDAAHAAGLGVALDLVYNHLGPDGNYLGEYAALPHRQARHPLGQGSQPRRHRQRPGP